MPLKGQRGSPFGTSDPKYPLTIFFHSLSLSLSLPLFQEMQKQSFVHRRVCSSVVSSSKNKFLEKNEAVS